MKKTEPGTKRNIEIRLAKTNLHVRAEEVVLPRLLDNLLGDAVRNTHSGKILVGARRTTFNPEQSGVLFQVYDTGTGIRADEVERLMRPFQRGEYQEMLEAPHLNKLGEKHSLWSWIINREALLPAVRIPAIDSKPARPRQRVQHTDSSCNRYPQGLIARVHPTGGYFYPHYFTRVAFRSKAIWLTPCCCGCCLTSPNNLIQSQEEPV